MERTPHKIGRYLLLAGLLLLLVLLLTPRACRSEQAQRATALAPVIPVEGKPLAFTILARDEWGGYEESEPTLFVIQEPADVETVERWIKPEAIARLAELDYAHHFALAAFQGEKPSSGYGVQIESVRLHEGQVNVYAQFEQPAPGSVVDDVMTHPYYIVRVAQLEGWADVRRFWLIVAGQEVARFPPVGETGTR